MTPPRSGPSFVVRFRRELSVASALALMLLLLAIFAPKFFTPQPLLSRLAAAAPNLILVCGMTLVLIARQIDIAIGSLVALCGTCASLVASHSMGLAVVVSLGVGALAGAFNGVLVAGLGLPGIVVTLATMVTWREALRLWRQGVFINLPEGAQWFGLSMRAGQFAVIIVALLIFALVALALARWSAGRFVYATGSAVEAARLAGLRPRWVTFVVFVVMGICCGLAAVLQMVQSPQFDPNTGRGLELETIAAVVVGGVAVSGGRGTIWGALAGLLLLVCISPALTFAGVKAHWEKAIQGSIILVAVMSDGGRKALSWRTARIA